MKKLAMALLFLIFTSKNQAFVNKDTIYVSILLPDGTSCFQNPISNPKASWCNNKIDEDALTIETFTYLNQNDYTQILANRNNEKIRSDHIRNYPLKWFRNSDGTFKKTGDDVIWELSGGCRFRLTLDNSGSFIEYYYQNFMHNTCISKNCISRILSCPIL